MDVKTAFLNGRLDEEVYMAIPEGLKISSENNMVCKLNKSIYGLKQSSRQWYQRIDSFLLQIAFTRANADQNVYVHFQENAFVYLALYVDDCILASNSLRLLTKIKEKLKAEFEMVDLEEIHHCLGMEVDRNREEGWIRISQPRYLVEKLARFNMADCKPIDTPMEPDLKLSTLDSPNSVGESEEVKNIPYQAAVGSLMWAMVCTRPDISFAVSSVAQFMSNPGLTHWKAVKRIFRYLRGTLDFSLVFTRVDKPSGLTGYSDAVSGGCLDTRRSTSGYCFQLNGGTISWTSKKQKSTSKTLPTEKTPYELWQRQKPDLRNLQVFGCTAFAHIEKGHRGKIDPKSVECVFLGYSTTAKGYRVQRKDSHKILESRSVRFMSLAVRKATSHHQQESAVPPAEQEALYVDDCILASNSLDLLTKIKSKLKTEFDMVDLEEIHQCLGMQVDRNREERWIRISQPRYLVEKLARFNMADCKPIDTPMEPGLKSSVLDSPNSVGESEEVKDIPYQAAVGRLMWAMVCTRPNISFAVSSVPQFMSNPGLTHWKAVKRIFRYLKGTLDFGLVFTRVDKPSGLTGYSDAVSGGCLDTRRSTSGYCFQLNGGTISWTSKKQKSVSLSSTCTWLCPRLELKLCG
ncbi:hypothetical protein AXG93_1054s1050 [Marchantia polymorpha subsp. ruderalis]|uniref:Reverse transcriptase Ty1/copia-type domain-containing protein n=1 Tax=Marchantia polymorpha subsp. ruderalis TaxID=1480154 RepID=A0A176WNY2_MARPO|nr:hypothetical protein AXG93_1054s1050 [Marchantia polymorpha subsp. ruderalis]